MSLDVLFVIWCVITAAQIFAAWKLGGAVAAYIEELSNRKKSGPGGHPPQE